MNIISVNFKIGKTYDPHTLLLNLTDKIDLKRKDKYTALSILSIYHTWKNIRKSYKNNNFKISTPALNYLMDHILYQIYRIILNMY